MFRMTSACAVVFSLAFFSNLSHAQENDATRKGDEQFLVQAVSFLNAEIDVGKKASKRATREDVRNLANHMIKEHQRCFEAIGLLLKDRKVNLAAEFDPAYRDQIADLFKKEGSEFDVAYLKWVIQNHDKGIANFEGQVKRQTSNDVSKFASAHVGPLRHHREQAIALLKNAPK